MSANDHLPLHVAPAVDGANAVYTDVWISMGEEAEQDRRRAELN